MNTIPLWLIPLLIGSAIVTVLVIRELRKPWAIFSRIPTTTAPLTTHIYKRGEKVAEGGPALLLYGRTPDGRHWHLVLTDTGSLSPIGHVITAEAPDKSLPPFSNAAVLIDVDNKVIEDRRDVWFPNTRWNDTAAVTSFHLGDPIPNVDANVDAALRAIRDHRHFDG